MTNENSHSNTRAETILAQEVKELTKEISRLKNMDFMQVFSHPIKFMFYSFMKGLMVGLGTVLGASVLVALLIYLLTKISFVPIVGDFVKDIIGQIQVEQLQTTKNPAMPTKSSTSKSITP
ncbi:hypothetical protein HZA40_04885 [Candidatus Peregrinibacteria bacterium]|nr:hypothetical protein [Candidatus Peregrinibacteria bacterium]